MTWWKSVYGDERDTVFRYVTFRSATHHDPVTYFLSPPPVLLDVCGHGSKHGTQFGCSIGPKPAAAMDGAMALTSVCYSPVFRTLVVSIQTTSTKTSPMISPCLWRRGCCRRTTGVCHGVVKSSPA